MLSSRDFQHLCGSKDNRMMVAEEINLIDIRQIALLLLTAVSSLCAAQGVSSATLRQGTPIALVFTSSLNSESAATGDKVNFVLTSNVQVNGATVAKAGAKVSGEVTFVKRAATAGRSGEINLRLDDLLVGDKRIKLSGSKDKTIEPDVQYSRPYHLKWPMGLLRTGDNVEISSGTLLTVFVAEEVTLPQLN